MSIELTLSADGMGEQATEADFDAWAGYVAGRIDERTGLDVSVDQHDMTGPRAWPEDTIRGADGEEREIIREALRGLWDEFCADANAWPTSDPAGLSCPVAV